MELSGMNKLKKGDRVVVLRIDSKEIEYHGSYAGASGPFKFILPDDDNLLDPVEVDTDRVLPEKGRRLTGRPVPPTAPGRPAGTGQAG
jgi:hypothetical protein